MDFVALYPDQQLRFLQLVQALHLVGMHVRDDSDVCWDFILHGDKAREVDLKEIVLKMKKARFLHEYCDFELGYAIAKKKLGQRRIKKNDWLSFVRQCVLSTTREKGYPKIWPWEKNITPEAWKTKQQREADLES